MYENQLEHFIQRIDKKLLRYGLLGKQNWGAIDKVFIVSTGRTGTKFFAKFFSFFPSTLSLHEPNPSCLKLAVDYAQELVSYDTAVKTIEENRRVLGRSAKRLDAKLYIESNNRFFSLLKPLREVFPDAKIVYIVRDGRDYVRSGMARWWYTEEDRGSRLRADMFPSDPYASKWEEMSRFEKIAWRWQKKDGLINKNFQYLDNAIKVTFEDIFKSPDRKGLFEITRFIGIPDSEVQYHLDESKIGDKKVNTNRKEVIPKWQNWSDEMKHEFDAIAGEHMKLHYAYDLMS
ncbi:sulfotransferase [Lusitaniella coriacea LEGE 07157]|uniref:Sulfotransferase n=2 Tax=Lusitaniella TaxID=1983104 RepID=A0A8J7IUR1_9CYAN|nr:sulfotransferase [Lusitaniella coriacea LEGE 07157]